MKRDAVRLLLTALLLVSASAAYGAGFAVWEMGTKSSAMGGVLTASADDPTAIFFNPAGVGRLDGRQATLDLTVIKPYTEFSGVAPNPGYGVTEHLDDPLFFLPQAYYTQRINDKLGLGLGFYTPYGLAVEWADPENFSGRDIATLTDLKTFFLTPTVGYNVNDMVSVGVGLNLVKGHVELNRAIFDNIPDHTELGVGKITGGSDWAFGFNAGVMMDVGERSTLGFSYKSQIDLSFSGDAEFTSPQPPDGPAETALPLPALFSVGVASQVSDKLMLEFNFNRINWSVFEKLEFVFPDSPKYNEEIEENYVNTSQYRFGAEYQATPELAIRGGFVLDETPQHDEVMGPILPDANRKGYSLGGAYDLGAMTLDFYYLALFLEDREIRDNQDNFNGDYSSFTTLAGFGLTYRF